MSQPPNRFGERAFRAYEPFIDSVVRAWPSVTQFDITKTGLSLETFTNRLRDAMHGFARYDYHSTINRSVFQTAYSQGIQVAQASGGQNVLVGPAQAIKATRVQPITSVSTTVGQTSDVYTLNNPSQQVLHAFCLLLSERLIDRPVLVKMMDADLLLKIQDKYDISVTAQDGGGVLIV